MTTTKQPTISDLQTPTRSSAATTAASSNAAGAGSSSTPKTSKPRNVYPCLRACKVCGKDFTLRSYRDGGKQTCSPECARALLSAKRRGQGVKPLAERKGAMIVCPYCGREVWKPAAWLRKTKAGGYCSRSCRAKHATAPLLTRHAANGKGKKRPGKGLAGERNPAWKGGVTYFKTHGNYTGVKYVRCPPELIGMARKDGYVMEHRLFVAQAIGRLLLRSEVVHHEDHNPANNALDNLQLFATNRDHKLYEHHGAPAPIWQL